MTVQEAIKKHITECEERIFRIKDHLESSKDAHVDECKENILVLETAIQALEEVEQYRALGTVEELKEAREKQVAKRPKDMQDDANGIDVWVTCECGAMMLINTDLHKQGYCRKCGQLMEFPQPYKKEGAE